MRDGISSKNTQHKYETFDGVKLNFTNWETGYEPKLWDGIIFSYENYKPFLLEKCLKSKKNWTSQESRTESRTKVLEKLCLDTFKGHIKR